MSNVFDKVIKIAQSRAEWELEVNPDGGAIMFKSLTESQIERSQAMSDGFIAEIVVAAKTSGFKTVEDAKAFFNTMDYETQYLPLWRMSELCIPINSDTSILAEAIAPIRLSVISRIKDGKFAQYEPLEDALEPEAERVLVHHAKYQAFVSEPKRGDAARELQSKRAEAQSSAFQSLAGAIGGVTRVDKGSKIVKSQAAPKDIDAVVRRLDEKLGGVRVVGGEVQKVAAKGQMKLFDEESAPSPKVEKKTKPKMGK